MIAQHSTASQEHYTPQKYIEAARKVMGGIELDPCSNFLAQRSVEALSYYGWKLPDTAPFTPYLDDAMRYSWYANSALINPPGGDTSKVRKDLSKFSRSFPLVFWAKTLHEYKQGNLKQAIFVCFQLNLWANSQSFSDFQPMQEFDSCITDHRIKFNHPSHTELGLPTPNAELSPSHNPPGFSAFVHLPNRDEDLHLQRENFRKEFSQFGTIVGVKENV